MPARERGAGRARGRRAAGSARAVSARVKAAIDLRVSGGGISFVRGHGRAARAARGVRLKTKELGEHFSCVPKEMGKRRRSFPLLSLLVKRGWAFSESLSCDRDTGVTAVQEIKMPEIELHAFSACGC